MSLRHVAIRASAGAGKTYQLTSRYVELLAAGESVDKLLASTFSRKAAGEIILRVFARVVARGDESLVANVTKHIHRLRIGTLDAFFMGLVQSFGLELGFPPTWRIIDEALDKAIKRRALLAALAEDRSLGRHVVALQRGEARRRIVAAVEDYVQLYLPTFVDAPEAAWRFVPESVTRRPLRSLEEVLHALARVPLSKATMQLARDKDVEKARAGEISELMRSGVSACVLRGQTTYNRADIPQALQAEYEALHDVIRYERGQQLLLETQAVHALLAAVHRHYAKQKRALDGFGFDDVSRTLARELSGRGALDAETLTDISFRLDGRIHHLLLDEFQDTALAQWQVLEPLAKEIASYADGSHSFFCVGDVKQAIYGWRGGISEIFDRVDQALLGIERKPLDESRRSSGVVIGFVNDVFQELEKNPALAGNEAAARAWQEGFSLHRTVHDAMAGHVWVASAPRSKDKQGNATLASAADKVAELHRGCPRATIGVLVRRNDAVRRMIWELAQRQVAASEEGGNPLTDSPAVMLVLSLMTLADHPGDTIARYHVASSVLGEALGYQEWRSDPKTLALGEKVRRALLERGYGATVRHYVALIEGRCDARSARRLGQLAELAGRYDQQAKNDTASLLRTRSFVAFVQETKMEEPLPSPVRVMTIHQAKGLEFDVALVCDIDEALSPQHSALVVGRDDPLARPARIFRTPSKAEQALFPELKALCDTHATQTVKEKLSNLYVALTRPKHALYLVLSPDTESAKIVRPRVGNVARAAVRPEASVPAGSVIYEAGDPKWATRVEWPAPREGSAAPQKRAIALRAPARFLTRATPSSLEGGMRVDVREHLRLERRPALERGAALHAWLEKIAWLEDGEAPQGPEPALLAHAGVQAALRRDRFQAEGSHLRVYREMPFAVREGKVLLTGSFDRVVVRRGASEALWIIDWKTDRIGDERELARRVAYYKPQLEAYRRAAVTVFRVPITHITCELVFLGLQGRTVQV